MLLNNLARTLNELQRFPEATAYAERAYAQAKLKGDEIVVSQALSVRFGISIERRDYTRAAAILAELEPRWRRMMPPSHIAFAVLPMHQAQIASGRGDHADAVAKADQSVALAEANAQGLDYLPRLLLRRAGVNLEAGRPAQARADAERSLAMELKATDAAGMYSGVGSAQLMLARALSAEGRADDARIAASQALRNLEESVGADHPKTREARRLAHPS